MNSALYLDGTSLFRDFDTLITFAQQCTFCGCAKPNTECFAESASGMKSLDVFASNGRANICADRIVNCNDRRSQSERFSDGRINRLPHRDRAIRGLHSPTIPHESHRSKLYKCTNRNIDRKGQIKTYVRSYEMHDFE